MRKVRGYTGWYKEIYLRSFLEFAYAYYLDNKHVNWKYEQEIFYLDEEVSYKPDFYIYDNKNNLIKIVEVKGNGNKETGILKAELFRQKYSHKLEMIFYKDLVKLYREEMPMRLNTAKNKWINDYGATLENKLDGEYNPMFGRKQSEKTRKLISKKAKLRFDTGKYFETNTKKMIEYNRSTNYEHTRRRRSEREQRVCLYEKCAEIFEVTIASKKRYCTHECVLRNNSKMANEAYLKKVKSSHEQIAQCVHEWSLKNKCAITNMKLNRIKEPLTPMYDLIEKSIGIKDIRTITIAVLGEDKGRKELVKYLKEYIQ